MPWIHIREHTAFYREILYRNQTDNDIGWVRDSQVFRDFMLQDYGIEVTSETVKQNGRFYLDDRNHTMFLLRWT